MALVIVMRHAKAVDRMQAEDDFERGLTERGVSDADRAAAALQSAGYKADMALVSPARRTRETWARLRETLGSPEVTDPMALYHASPSMLERALTEALQTGAQTVSLVGHNPGIGALVHTLAGQAEQAADLPYGWPTSGVAAFKASLVDGKLTASKRTLYFNPKEH